MPPCLRACRGRGECHYRAGHDKAPSMYEMEGALPGRVAPGSPVARLTRHHAPPAGTGNPRDVPVSRYFPRPGVAPRRFPFPTVKVFLLLSPAVAQESGGIHFKFFGIHMITADVLWISCGCRKT